MFVCFSFRAARLASTAAILCAVVPAAAGDAASPTDASSLTLQVVSASPPVAVKTDISKDLSPPPAFEAPPVVVKTANGRLVFATTAWSWLCRNPGDILQGGAHLGADNCRLFSGPARIDPHRRNDPQTGLNVSPDELARSLEDWRRNYSGVMSAVKLDRKWNGYDLVAAVHGEDKNERVGDRLYANTVNADVAPAACADGVVDGAYAACWEAYNAFISLVFVNTKSGRKLDLGPVVWPAAGYVAGSKKASQGVRHPSLFLAGQYLYLYYLDASQGSDPDRRGGIHVARIDLSRSSPTSLAAVSFFKDGFADDERSLPSGFDKHSLRQFFAAPGGRASELWPKSWEADRFSVTRLRNTRYFLGVEEYGGATEWGVRLRLSRDLVHWSDPVAVPGLTAPSWTNGALHYPIFSDAAGEDSQSVDPDDFYLVGSATQTGILRQHLSIRVSDGPRP